MGGQGGCEQKLKNRSFCKIAKKIGAGGGGVGA